MSKIPDVVKAVGTVVGVFLGVYLVALVLYIAIMTLDSVVDTKPLQETAKQSLANLAFGLVFLISAVNAMKQIKKYDAFGRAVGGALCGLLFAVPGISPKVSVGGIIAFAVIGCVISLSSGTKPSGRDSVPTLPKTSQML